MPKTDYADPEIEFPRLEARIHKTDDDAFWITIWQWDGPGDGGGSERRQIINRKQAGSYADMPEVVYGIAHELNVFIGPDDITINGH
jgi:hypothetical protein